MPRRRASAAVTVDEQAIGQRLREIRERRNLTQVQLAEKLGLDQTLISAYERGKIRMHAGLIAALAKTLRVSADDLLGLKQSKQNGAIKSRGLRKRAPEIDRLPPRELRTLLQTIDQFLRAARTENPTQR